MKNIINILFTLIITTISCKAQSPIIPIENQINDDYEDIENSYLKDVNNKLNPFIGTWKWEDTATNTSFTIEFFKLEKVSFYGEYYKDYLIGKYRFVKNGIELFNSLNLTGINTTTIRHGAVWGKLIYASSYTSDNIIDFSVYDNIKHKYCKADTEITTPIFEQNSIPVTLTGAKMKWRMRMRTAPFIEQEFSPYDYIAYPTNIILTKQ